MKRIAALLFAVAVALTAGTASGLTVDLIADGGDPATATVIGTVEITDDGTDLTVVYTTVDGWELLETHLGINDGIVVKGNGSVKVGQLSVAGEKTGRCFDPPVTTTTYTCALADLNIGPDGVITVAAHAAARIWMDAGEDLIEGTEDDNYREESAWADGEEFTDGRNWAMYVEYVLPPDLVVVDLIVLSATDTSITWAYTIQNVGLGPVANAPAVAVQAFVSADDVFSPATDTPAGGTILYPDPPDVLYPGEIFSSSFSAAYTPDPASPYLVLMVDWGDIIAESDETNNTAATLILDIN